MFFDLNFIWSYSAVFGCLSFISSNILTSIIQFNLLRFNSIKLKTYKKANLQANNITGTSNSSPPNQDSKSHPNHYPSTTNLPNSISIAVITPKPMI